MQEFGMSFYFLFSKSRLSKKDFIVIEELYMVSGEGFSFFTMSQLRQTKLLSQE